MYILTSLRYASIHEVHQIYYIYLYKALYIIAHIIMYMYILINVSQKDINRIKKLTTESKYKEQIKGYDVLVALKATNYYTEMLSYVMKQNEILYY